MRAVQVRRALREQYGTQLSPQTEQRMRWLLAHTSMEARDLNKTAMENLRALRAAWRVARVHRALHGAVGRPVRVGTAADRRAAPAAGAGRLAVLAALVVA